MPRDQAPDTKAVADAASASYEQVEKGLQGVVVAAEEADAASAKLSDTQKEALKITRTFSKALNTYAEKREESLKVVRSSVRMEDTYNKKPMLWVPWLWILTGLLLHWVVLFRMRLLSRLCLRVLALRGSRQSPKLGT